MGTANSQICDFGHAQKLYHRPSLLVESHIEMLVQLIYLFGLQPLLGIGELADGAVDVELSRPQISSVPISMCPPNI